MGPVLDPKEVKTIFDDMKKDNQIEEVKTIFKGYEQHRFVSKIKDIDFYNIFEDLRPEQVQIIDDVLEKLSNMTATRLVNILIEIFHIDQLKMIELL